MPQQKQKPHNTMWGTIYNILAHCFSNGALNNFGACSNENSKNTDAW